jgi:hypothetical protein
VTVTTQWIIPALARLQYNVEIGRAQVQILIHDFNPPSPTHNLTNG